MIYELRAWNTDHRYPDDIRYREYTASTRRAEAFSNIPKIQFTDSGHGVVFHAFHHKGTRLPRRTELYDYVHRHLLVLRAQPYKPGRTMTEAQFQQIIADKGFTEFRLQVTLNIRCGGEQLGWTMNDVDSVISNLLPKNGIMVDKCSVNIAANKRAGGPEPSSAWKAGDVPLTLTSPTPAHRGGYG